MAYYGISDFSLISSNFGSSSKDSIYGLTSDYSQALAVRTALRSLNSESLSAKNPEEAAAIKTKIDAIHKSISNQADAFAPSYTASNGSSRVSELAKEQGQKMYEEYTGNGTNINTTI